MINVMLIQNHNPKLTGSLTDSLTHSLTHSLTPTLTHTHTHETGKEKKNDAAIVHGASG